MSDKLIPADTQRAAKRGFIRTASQSIATSLGGGVTVAALAQVANNGNPDWWTIGAGAAVFVLGPVINGAQSYFSILGAGIPEDYAPASPDGI
jgi:hypothetical protein